MNDDADAAALLIDAAALAGTHALALFAALFVTVLGGTVLAWRWLQRHAVPRWRRLGVAPPLAAALGIGLGFVAIVAAAALFAEIAEALDAEAAVGAADAVFTSAVRDSVPPAALHAFAVLTRLGDPLILGALGVAVAVALLARRRRLFATGWALALVGNALLSVTLKQLFARVRPPHDDGLVLAHGYSFPSGHSSGALVVYGMLAYLAARLLPPRWQLPAVLAAMTLALTVGASRVFLRVHYASDVLAGFVSGAAWLAVCVVAVESARWWRARRTRPSSAIVAGSGARGERRPPIRGDEA
jgi:membrane-associated phospholipid phosphatase